MDNAIVTIRQLSKRFGSTDAVQDVNIAVRENEFFSLLGPSGCGKTTLLRMIAGLESPSRGELLIGAEDMAHTPANKRPVNMVFQSYAVFPHMSVADNVGYGLRVTGVSAAETRQRAHEALEMVKLDHLAQRRPDMLSGGQRQRVALARALVKRPKVLLLDEPMSALDAKLREQMQIELTRLQKAVGITFIMVTHDQQEALSMSDRIAVMDNGRISQLGTPEDLYERPANCFVADFIGRINLLDAKVVRANGEEILLNIAGLGHLQLEGEPPSTPVSLAIRPEHVRLSAPEETEVESNCLQVDGRIARQAFMGDSSQITIETENGLTLAATQRREDTQSARWQVGDSVLATLPAEHCRLLAA